MFSSYIEVAGVNFYCFFGNTVLLETKITPVRNTSASDSSLPCNAMMLFVCLFFYPPELFRVIFCGKKLEHCHQRPLTSTKYT